MACCLGDLNVAFVSWTFKPAHFKATSRFTDLAYCLCSVCFTTFVCELISRGVAFAENLGRALGCGSVCLCQDLDSETPGFPLVSQLSPSDEHSACLFLSGPEWTSQFWTHQWAVSLDILRETCFSKYIDSDMNFGFLWLCLVHCGSHQLYAT